MSYSMVGIVIVVCLGCFLLGPSPSCAEEAKKVWTVEGTESRFTLDEATLQVTVDCAGTTWRMRPAGKDDLVITADGKRTRVSFLDAEKIEGFWRDYAEPPVVKMEVFK